MLEYIILGMAYESELTGYDIKKYIERGIGLFTKTSFGSLYPALNRLTERKYISMSAPAAVSGRQKKYYTATPSGRDYFLKWLSSPPAQLTSIDDIMPKIYFLDYLPDELRTLQLALIRYNCQDYLNHLLEQEEELKAISLNQDTYYFKMSTLYYGICTMRTVLDWLDHISQKKSLTDLLSPSKEVKLC